MFTIIALFIGRWKSRHISKSDKKKTKKLRKQMRIITPSAIVVDITVIVLVVSMIVNYIGTTFSVIAGYRSSYDKEQAEIEESQVNDWKFKSKQINETHNGLYPKDIKLRLRAELLEIARVSANDSKEATGNNIEPCWVIGTIFRESGNSILNIIDSQNISSLFTDLLITNNACSKGGCNYIDNGISHYYGGTVEDGIDKGNPYTDIINISKELYDKYGNNDHAIGFTQFEAIYTYHYGSRIYGDKNEALNCNKMNVEEVKNNIVHDEKLGFVRPNNSFVPDQIYNASFLLANKETEGSWGTKIYTDTINSEQYNKLSEYNKNAIKFMFASAAYNRGQMKEPDKVLVDEIMSLINNNVINTPDSLLSGDENEFWNSETNLLTSGELTFIQKIKSKYNINTPDSSEYYPVWRSLYAMNIGKVAYEELTKAINEAEKINGKSFISSKNGNWVDYPGSGRFGNDNSNFYDQTIGCRWYRQSSNTSLSNTVANDGTVWGNIRFLKNGTDTLAETGCGIICLSMMISNLINMDVTPDIVAMMLNKPEYYYGLISVNGVQYVAETFGLTAKGIAANTKKELGSVIDSELENGNTIMVWLYASKDGLCPWKNKAGYHYVGIRGKTEDGKYLCFNSCGYEGKDPVGTMNTPLTWEQIYPYLNQAFGYSVGTDVNR